MKKIFSIKLLVFLSIVLGLLILSSCGSNVSAPLKVTILHVNDTHSNLEPLSYDLTLGGEKTRVALGGMPQLLSVIHEEEESSENPILLHAGDALVGTIYYTLTEGKSDADILNEVNWDAFVLGNHEFDGGNEVLEGFLSGFNAPVVAANVVAEKGSILQKKWDPYVIVNVENQKIGIIGINIVGKTKNSSNPGDDISFTDEYETTQKYVDVLTKKGINKIIVLTHIGHKNAKTLAKTVSGVDIIVTGDSHTLLDDTDLENYGLHPEDKYPTRLMSPDNEPVYIVQAWEYAKALGKLEVEFDASGIVTATSGRAFIIISDSFKRKDASGKRVELEGAARDAVYTDIEANASLVLAKEDADGAKIVAEYRAEKDEQGKEVVAIVADEIPGGSDVRIPKVSQGGHFTAQVVADGSYERLKSMGTGKVDGVIQNAGGVRIPLNKGDLNVETIYTLLPFSNTIMTIELTGAELRTALEQAIDFALSPDGSTGSFPYTAGFRYTADLEAQNGQRVSMIEFNRGGSWGAYDSNATYTIGVNNYIAGGKDGYFILGEIDASKKVDLYINDADVFAEYVKGLDTLKKPEVTNVILK